jgi:hypothetical protein
MKKGVRIFPQIVLPLFLSCSPSLKPADNRAEWCSPIAPKRSPLVLPTAQPLHYFPARERL